MTDIVWIGIGGTFRDKHDHPQAWYRYGSPFHRTLMSMKRIRRFDRDGDPEKPDHGYWTGALGGTLFQEWAPWLDHRAPWREAAPAVTSALKQIRHRHGRVKVLIVAHSHGGQVMAYALAGHAFPDLEIYIVTVDMPVRQQMLGVYDEARQNPSVKRWTHLYSGFGPRSLMRVLGSRFGKQAMPFADRGIPLKGGHKRILTHPRFLQQWAHILPVAVD